MLEYLFVVASEMKTVVASGGAETLRRKCMCRLFYEPSTRTWFSFGQAMRKLGGDVDGEEHARIFSSAVKGEVLEDTIETVNRLHFDVIVLRHYEAGAAERAARVSNVPVINAGDGAGQHPTQALLDLYTLREELGRIDGISVALVGDLKRSRVVRSLAYLLGKFHVGHLYFVSGHGMEAHEGILDYLARHDVAFSQEHDLREVAPQVHAIYETRLQLERIADGADALRAAYETTYLTEEVVRLMGPETIVMHPLPRNEEVPLWFNADRRAAYFRQVENGLYMRMALLTTILGSRKEMHHPEEVENAVREAKEIL